MSDISGIIFFIVIFFVFPIILLYFIAKFIKFLSRHLQKKEALVSEKEPEQKQEQLKDARKRPVQKKLSKFTKAVIAIFAIVIISFLGLILGLIILDKQSNIEERPAMKEEDILKMIQDAMDDTNPITRDFAVQLASQFPLKESNTIDQICAVYDHIYSKWKYVPDPRNNEFFSRASRTIEIGLAGDCDDFAILMATAIEAIGSRSRVIAAYGPQGGHAYAEVFCGNVNPQELTDFIDRHYTGYFRRLFGFNKVKAIHYHVDQGGNIWLNLDWWSKYPGGPFFEANKEVAYYPKEGFYEILK